MMRAFLLAMVLGTMGASVVTPVMAAAPQAGEVAAADGVTKIAVVDMESLLNDSAAAKDIRAQLEAKNKTYQQEVEKLEHGLKDTESSLIAERKTLKPEEFDTRRKAFEKKLIDTRKQVQAKRKSLDMGTAGALNKLKEQIVKIVATIAEKEKFDLVLSRQNVVLVAKPMDITAQAMSQLNANVTSIKVEFPSVSVDDGKPKSKSKS
jgi:outer membrane protein